MSPRGCLPPPLKIKTDCRLLAAVGASRREHSVPEPDKGNRGSSELHQTVRGGEHILIRPVRPEDLALYRDFLADVSAEDLRLRFFARTAELSAEETDKLGHLDYKHETAFVALDEDTGRMLGLVRLKDELDEKTAEFAILVRSRFKGHGVGWMLMRRIIDYAKEKRKRAASRVWRRIGAKSVEMGESPDQVNPSRGFIGQRPLALGHDGLRVFADRELADRSFADWSLADRRRRRRRLLARQIGGGRSAQHG